MVSRMELFGRSGETATCCRSSSRGPGYARRSQSGPVVGLTFRGPANRVLAEAVQAAGDEVGNCSPMRFSVGGHERKPLAEGSRVIGVGSEGWTLGCCRTDSLSGCWIAPKPVVSVPRAESRESPTNTEASGPDLPLPRPSAEVVLAFSRHLPVQGVSCRVSSRGGRLHPRAE